MTINATTYISLNGLEIESFSSVSHEAIALYLLYKQKANFRTGELGRFFNQKLNYARFARDLSRPPSQGRPAKTFSTTDVKRLTDQLESVGLVEAVKWDGERLTMKLPYSPLWRGNEQISAPAPAQETTAAPTPTQQVPDVFLEEEERLLWGESPMDGLKPTHSGASGDFDETSSILTSERGSIPFFNTVSNDSGGTSNAAAIPKKAATPAASELPPASSSEIEALFEKLMDSAGALMPETTISRRYYAAWAKAGVTIYDAREAVKQLIGTNEPFRPGDVNERLFPAKAARRIQHLRQLRGGVAL